MYSSTATTDTPEPVADDATCEEPAGWLCDQVLRATDGDEAVARLVDWLVGKPLTIIAILLIAWIVAKLVRRVVRQVVHRTVISTTSLSALRFNVPDADDLRASMRHRLGGEYGHSGDADDAVDNDEDDASPPDRKAPLPVNSPERPWQGDGAQTDHVVDERQRAAGRAESIAGVVGSTATVGVWTMALLMVVGEIGVPLGPLVAGAGIGGIALGFGAQSLVKDCISGLFMLIEDQYGIGDVVDLGEAVGSVERITLRATVLRGIDGTVWHVPNGEIQRVGNKSQRWSVALVDVDVAYTSELERAQDVIFAAAIETCVADDIAPSVLAEPEVLGIEHLGADGITVRTVVRTRPGDQWGVQRALRASYKRALTDAGIEIPFPQRTVWLRSDEQPA